MPPAGRGPYGGFPPRHRYERASAPFPQFPSPFPGLKTVLFSSLPPFFSKQGPARAERRTYRAQNQCLDPMDALRLPAEGDSPVHLLYRPSHRRRGQRAGSFGERPLPSGSLPAAFLRGYSCLPQPQPWFFYFTASRPRCQRSTACRSATKAAIAGSALFPGANQLKPNKMGQILPGTKCFVPG